MIDNEAEMGRLIFILANSVIKTRNRHLNELDITAVQADALRFFILNDGATATDLKKYLDISHQTANGIVRRMVSKGLLELNRSETDARCQIVTPTPAGIKLEERINQNRKRTGKLLTEHMSESEKEEFTRLLVLAFENIKGDSMGGALDE